MRLVEAGVNWGFGWGEFIAKTQSREGAKKNRMAVPSTNFFSPLRLCGFAPLR
jgi:hypothetical protein